MFDEPIIASRYTLTTTIPTYVKVIKVNDNMILFSIKLLANKVCEYTLHYEFNLISYTMQYLVNDKPFDDLHTALNYIDSEFRKVILEQYAN